jgi:very-short-patch-repair endonuclease
MSWQLSEIPWEWREAILRSGNPLVEDLLSGAVEECGPPCDWESPIEYAMALGMCMLRKTRYQRIGFDLAGLSEDQALRIAELRASTDAGDRMCPALGLGVPICDPLQLGCVFPQVTIGDYRVDFLVLHLEGIEGLGGVVIECDGHDYHERTKEQAARDKARDRDLQEQGYKVFRFTGSEIWRDTIGCADQPLRIAHDTAGAAECERSRARAPVRR